MVEGLKSASVEQNLGITADFAPALRLLYACLCPLDDTSQNGPELYIDFLRKVPAAVRQQITIPDVLRFVRAALYVPDGELFMLLALIDEGNQATGCWDHGGELKEVIITQFFVLRLFGCPCYFCSSLLMCIAAAINGLVSLACKMWSDPLQDLFFDFDLSHNPAACCRTSHGLSSI